MTAVMATCVFADYPPGTTDLVCSNKSLLRAILTEKNPVVLSMKHKTCRGKNT